MPADTPAAVMIFPCSTTRSETGVAPNSARARILQRVTETVLEAQLFRDRLMRAMEFSFTTLDDVLGQSGPLGTIWSVAGKDGVHPLFPGPAELETPEASSGALH